MVDEPALQTLWMTAYQRTLWDFELDISPENHANLYLDKENLDAAISEGKKLRKLINILYIFIFITAFYVLSGGSNTAEHIEAFGVSIPLKLFTQQAVATMMAGSFTYYLSALMSYFLLSSSQDKLYERYGPTSWRFLQARKDGFPLYVSLMNPKNVGYSSPRREIVVIWMIYAITLLTIIAHILLVLLASIAALNAALRDGGALAIALGSFAVAAVAITTVGFLFALFIRLPYRLKKVAE